MVNPAETGGRGPGEKPSRFSVTCSLLSQYLKVKGSFGDLSVGVTAAAAAGRPPVDGRGKSETLRTMNLLPGVNAVEGDEDSATNKGVISEWKKGSTSSMELFSEPADFRNKTDPNRESQVKTAQMTMFYGGKVVVFDNFPVDKAKELMMMAGRGTAPTVPSQCLSCPQPLPHNAAAAAASASAISSSVSDSNKPATVAAVAAAASAAQDVQQKPSQPAASDLPIPRRVSLQRFLEKRKDRINAKAPYQLNGASASYSASPAKPEESSKWLGLAPQVSKPEHLRR